MLAFTVSPTSEYSLCETCLEDLELLKISKFFCTYWAYAGKCWIKFWLDFNFLSLRFSLFIKNYHFWDIPSNLDRILIICSVLKNKTNVGPGDNVVQLIKTHSLHTLFAVFGEYWNFFISFKLVKVLRSNFYKIWQETCFFRHPHFAVDIWCRFCWWKKKLKTPACWKNVELQDGFLKYF